VVALASRSVVPLAALPATAAGTALLLALVAGPSVRRRTGLLLVGVAAASLVTTAAIVLADGVDVRSGAGMSTQAEVVAILVLIVVAVRYGPSNHGIVATGLAAVSIGMIVLRFRDPADEGVTVAGIAAWGACGLLASAVGYHLRSLDERRVRSVLEAQRAQRLHLARDLHDFVAHDVSEMLALAQAGQVVAAEHSLCADTFAKVEQAALRALRSMDQTVQMLQPEALPPGADESAHDGGQPTLTALAELAGRFADANGVEADLRVEQITTEQLRRIPYEVSATLYRVAVEALTNVRRHARAPTKVTIAVRRSSLPGGKPAIDLSVLDDAGGQRPSPATPVSRHNGLGLPTLAERVEGLGGQFTAGPVDQGWQVKATVPWNGGGHPQRT
jgi:signal transduction histidine kinase